MKLLEDFRFSIIRPLKKEVAKRFSHQGDEGKSDIKGR
jgi:hypothetical protein